ncbi:MAG: autoinducer binding domain-containing protein [Pseudomonadota bacterium]
MTTTLSHELMVLGQASPGGYAVGLHVRFTSPSYLFQTYAPAWNEFYSSQGLVMRDPTVTWGFANEGAVRWSALASEDTAGVLTRAAEHGLTFGVAGAVLSGGSRTLAGFARSDREFNDAEISVLMTAVANMHALTLQGDDISAEDRATIEAQSITV